MDFLSLLAKKKNVFLEFYHYRFILSLSYFINSILYRWLVVTAKMGNNGIGCVLNIPRMRFLFIARIIDKFYQENCIK